MPKLPSPPVSQVSGNTLCDQSPEWRPEADPSYPTGRHAEALAAFIGEIIARAQAAAHAAQEEAA